MNACTAWKVGFHTKKSDCDVHRFAEKMARHSFHMILARVYEKSGINNLNSLDTVSIDTVSTLIDTLHSVKLFVYTMSSQEMETRVRILEATQQLMEEHRGKGVSMSQIAQVAGISRQAVYLHFTSRADLLVATTRHMDRILGMDQRMAPSRTAANGVERLDAYIEFWGNYIPEIYGIAKALLLVEETDEAAAKAWNERVLEMREECQAVIKTLENEQRLAREWDIKEAADLLLTMLSIRNWELLTFQGGWSTRQYIKGLQTLAKRTFVHVDSHDS